MTHLTAMGWRYLGFILAPVLGLALTTAKVSALDLVEIYRLGLANDPAYLSAGASNRAAQERRPQARAALLPAIRMSADVKGNEVEFRDSDTTTGGDARQNFNSKTLQISATQPIFRRDLWIQLEQADLQIKQANAQYAFAIQDLITRLSNRYFAVLSAIDNLTFVRAEKEANAKQLEQSRQRFDVGIIAITDVQEAKAGFDRSVADEILALNTLDNTREQLREITGHYHEDLAALSRDFALVAPTPSDIDEWTEIGIQQNLQLAAARYAAEVAREEIRRIEAGHLPTLDLVGSHTRALSNGGIDGSGTSGGDRWTSIIGLELNLPIYEGGVVLSRSREALHLHRQAVDELERQRRGTQRQTREAFLGVLSGISRVNALAQAVASTVTAAEAIEAGFQVGTRTSVDVLNAQRDLAAAKRDYAAARYDYILDILALKQAAGTLSEEDLHQVNSWLQ